VRIIDQATCSRATYSRVLFLFLGWFLSGVGAESFAESSQGLVEAVMEVASSADGAEPGETMIVLRGPGGVLFLDEEEFSRLRLKLPRAAPEMHEGHRYYAPAAINGCTVDIDEAHQRAIISAPASAFETTHLNAAERQHPIVTPSALGGFLNYQLSAQQIESDATAGVLGELGVFAGAGVLTNSVVGRYEDSQEQLIRLDTTYTREFPDRLETVSVGDAISDPGAWGNAVRFAGVRWSHDFTLRPDLVTTPLLTAGGTATVPSSVDVFVNNQLATSSQVPAGPFVIDRLPTVSGTGDVNVVVRDALGREQVISQSFYTSTSLLAQGLSQYSVDLGSVRNNYALASDDYGTTLAEGTYRRGITDYFTLEAHAEYQAVYAHAAGLSAALGIGKVGVLNLIAANGGDSGGSGWLSGVGVEHRGTRVSFVASSLWATSNFAQVGQALSPDMRLRQRELIQTGLDMGRAGALSLAFVRQTYRDSPEQETLSLTHTLNLGRFGYLNLTLSRTHSPEETSGVELESVAAGLPAAGGLTVSSAAQNSTSAYLMWVLPLSGRRSASLQAVGGRGSGAPQNELIAGVMQSPPIGPGSGYRLSASTAGNYDAQWQQQFHAVDVQVEAARNDGIEGQSAYASGALVLIDGDLAATRTVNNSFAVVDVAGLPNVPVYVENQLTTRTDSSGKALLYNLRPYETNHISIQPEDLPLDTTIASTSTVLAPPSHSGVIARFPVERVRGGTFRLAVEDGTPVPAGAVVKFNGNEFPVVLDGTVYVTGYDHGSAGEANWATGRCMFRLDPPPSDDPLPDLGTIQCRKPASGDAF
jgi:outer membrane usher protein